MGEEASRLRDYAAVAPVAIWMTDAHGKPVFANAALRDYLGVAADDLDIFARIHPEDSAAFGAAMTAALAGQRPLRLESRWRRADAQWAWFRCEATTQRDASGKLLGLAGCNIDISDTHRLKQVLREEIAGVERKSRDDATASARHAFNNIVTVIVSGLRLLEGEKNADRRTLIIENIRQALEGAGIDSKGGARSGTPAKEAGAGRRVLVVEDGDGVATIACGMLERLAWTPVRVDSAEAALDLLARDRDFALVFSDVFMAEMNGIELADRIETAWPELPVLLTSGFSGRDLSSARPLLAKPYSMENLADAIAAVVTPQPT